MRAVAESDNVSRGIGKRIIMQNQFNLEANPLALTDRHTTDFNSPGYIRRLQQALNRASGTHLPLDGVMSFRTRRAIRNFQRQKGLRADGIVRLATERALFDAANGYPKSAAEYDEFELDEFANSPAQEIPQSDQPQANTQAVYQGIVAKIRSQLERRFTNQNDPMLLQRRSELRRLFGLVPPVFARTLYNQLQNQADPLGRLLHYRLAPATITELLRLLQNKIASVPTPSGGHAPPPKQPDLHTVVLDLLARGAPLPAALEPEFWKASIRLQSFLLQNMFGGKLSQARISSLMCMLTKLRESGADDRVILWGKICPIKSLMVPNPNKRCVREFSPIDEDLLSNYIKSEADIESASQKISGLIYRLKPMLLSIHLGIPRNDDPLLIDSLEELDWHIELTLNRLQVLFDENLAPSSRPRYLSAIRDWIGSQVRHPKSVYSC